MCTFTHISMHTWSVSIDCYTVCLMLQGVSFMFTVLFWWKRTADPLPRARDHSFFLTYSLYIPLTALCPLLVISSHNPFPHPLPFSSEQVPDPHPHPQVHQVSAGLDASSLTEARNKGRILVEMCHTWDHECPINLCVKGFVSTLWP